MTNISFRPYRTTDREACTELFDANCPAFFAPNERQEYLGFLESVSDGYEVCEINGKVVGAFGLFVDGKNANALNWIMLDPQTHGIGVGSKIMERVVQLGRASQAEVVNIAASQKSAPFFARFGATVTLVTRSGWGPGMDRVDMELWL